MRRFIRLSWQVTKAHPLWGAAMLLNLTFITASVVIDVRDGNYSSPAFLILANAFAGWLGWKLGGGRL